MPDRTSALDWDIFVDPRTTPRPGLQFVLTEHRYLSLAYNLHCLYNLHVVEDCSRIACLTGHKLNCILTTTESYTDKASSRPYE